MATYVTNEPTTGSNGMGFVLGLIVLAIFALIVFVYGLPMLSGGAKTGTQVNLPSEVNVQAK